MFIQHLKVTIFLWSMLFIFISCKEKNDLPDPLLAGWNNKAVCDLLEENEDVRVLKCTFAPGVGHEKHYHDPHFGYALSGSTFRIKDETGDRDVTVNSNTHFYSDGTKWHEVLNIGDSTAVFLIIEPK